MQRGHSHRTVTLAIIGINLVLIVAAYLAWQVPVLMIPLALASVAGLGAAWYVQVRHLRSLERAASTK